VPGIDLAGHVEANGGDTRFQPGDPVILTGGHYGEKFSGGFAGVARVHGDALVRLPDGMTLRQAMVLGTAGFTAMQCLMALESHGVKPGADQPVLVTGATGGVGSLAVILLSRLGYQVVAATGRAETEGDWLRQLGAAEILPRQTLNANPSRALETARWAGVIDTAGGDTLAAALRQTRDGGSVAACGLAGGPQLATTVFPFILRGVNLLGINSVTCPLPVRQTIWNRLAATVEPQTLDPITRQITLAEVPHFAHELLAGRLRGRVVVQAKPETGGEIDGTCNSTAADSE
jgi:acrylyl-CoA reductase (NADPH)